MHERDREPVGRPDRSRLFRAVERDPIQHGSIGLVDPDVEIPASPPRGQHAIPGRRQDRSDDPLLFLADLAYSSALTIHPDQALPGKGRVVGVHQSPVRRYRRRIKAVLRHDERLAASLESIRRKTRSPRVRHSSPPAGTTSARSASRSASARQPSARARRSVPRLYAAPSRWSLRRSVRHRCRAVCRPAC